MEGRAGLRDGESGVWLSEEPVCGAGNQLQLLGNSNATVFGLAILIWLFGPVSGAHFTPLFPD